MSIIKKVFLSLSCIIVVPVALYFFACLVGGSSLSETVMFLGRFIAQPDSVGAVAPSSRKLADALCLYVKPGQPGEKRYILEVGAGTGAVTQQIVSRLGSADHLDVVELDNDMAVSLQKKYGNNSQVNVVNDSITRWQPSYRYDAVVVGIPFNALPFAIVQEIWQHTVALVAPGGVFAYFAYAGLPFLKKAFLSGVKKKDFKNIQRYLKDSYRKNGIGKRTVWSNVPPAIVRYLRFA